MTSPVPTLGAARHSWMLLALTALFLSVANGRWQLPIAAWLAPAFLLLFIRSHRPLIGLGVGFLIQLGAYFINWWGIIPLPGVWYFVAAGVYAIVYFLPFVIHRWLASDLAGFRSTLILPMCWVAVELLVAVFTPYGTWASLAYTQVRFDSLIQIASVMGIAGVSFLIIWFAAVCSWAWGRRSRGLPTLRGGAIYLGVLLSVLAFGEFRVFFANNDAPTIRIAGLTPSPTLTGQFYESMNGLGGGEPDASSIERLHQAAERVNADLLFRSRVEAEAGADVVVWSEHASRVTDVSEVELVRRAGSLAREYSMVMVLGVGAWRPREQPSFENKAIIIAADGRVASEYRKAKPIVGQESSFINRGNERMAILDTDRARLGVVICHDLDFATFVRQSDGGSIDVLLGPSSDWDAITPLHAHMAVFRAVENGFSLVRPCSNGLSLTVDAFGRVLARRMDHDPDGSATISHVSLGQRKTPYSRIGELFSYLNLAGVVLLLASGVFKSLTGGPPRSAGDPR